MCVCKTTIVFTSLLNAHKTYLLSTINQQFLVFLCFKVSKLNMHNSCVLFWQRDRDLFEILTSRQPVLDNYS